LSPSATKALPLCPSSRSESIPEPGPSTVWSFDRTCSGVSGEPSAPRAPAGPAGPVGPVAPFGSEPRLKSFDASEPSLTSLPRTLPSTMSRPVMLAAA
jgi:hypothetical protein